MICLYRTHVNLTIDKLFSEVKKIVDENRQQLANAVNTFLTSTYWHIGKAIGSEVLNNNRAEYGKQILPKLSGKLTAEYGKGWSVKQLQEKIDSMLFERTAISKKPELLAQQEIQKLKDDDQLCPDLVFRDHYVLDFLNLKDTFSENDLESAIIADIELFILELGIGFTFIARQKRMSIDNIDYYLDLLFYHRKLKRLVAIELKIGKFKAAYKGQMELYLRWLEKYEMEPGENLPIGLILCAEGNKEQIELLQLDKANIKVAEYISKQLPKELLENKLHQFAEKARKIIDNRNNG